MKLGKLTEVDIRELWRHEQYDFSEWLSMEENIEMLSDEIGLTLTDVNKEVFVGSYRCDLVAKDAKNKKYNYGVKVSKQWYWYENWLDVVRDYCQKNNF